MEKAFSRINLVFEEKTHFKFFISINLEKKPHYSPEQNQGLFE